MLREKFRTMRLVFRNIRLWLPILKTDQQWDSYYIYPLLNHKLHLIEKMFRSNDTHTLNIIKYADEIKECRLILDRLMEDDYMSKEATDYYNNLRGAGFPLPSNKKETVMRWNEEEITAKKNDKKKLFALLEKNIDTWWD